ncbi:MAG: S9 family peptidase [Candidatus Sumerlaeia bacterium]|nr:S9 family peptidase [Candidatus Sumerlaeia bacterium]
MARTHRRIHALAAFGALVLLGGCATTPRLPSPADIPDAPAERRAAGELRLEAIPETPPQIGRRLAAYQSVRGTSFVDWSPSGWMMVRHLKGNTTQLYRLNRPGGSISRITNFEEPLASGTFLNKRDAFLYSMDEGGNELDQIHLWDMRDGSRTLLTDGVSRHSGYVLAPNEDRMAFSNNARTGSDFDVYVQDIRPGGAAQRVTAAPGSWYPMDFSPDGKRLLVLKYTSVTDSMAYDVDIATGVFEALRPGEAGTMSIGAAAYLRDGSGDIVYVSDEGSEFRRLRIKSADGTDQVHSADIDWDVDEVQLSDDGRWIAFATNEAGASRMYLLDLVQKERRQIDIGLGVLVSGGFSPDSSTIAYTVNGPTSPSTTFAYEIATGTTTQWTTPTAKGLDFAELVEPEMVEVSSFDGLPISAIYYKPEGPGPHPVLINFHGGPEAQSRPYFTSFHQFLVREMGIAVLDPNVRGSTGYGKTFTTLDNGRKREDSVKDGGALLDWIAARPELDASRVGVMGGSYGGYMTLAMLTNYPGRVRAGIDSVGISNFVTFLENTGDFRRDLRRVEYGDERDPEMRAFLESISPLTKADRIDAALLVIQGYNDPRVPYTEAEQIVQRVRAGGQPVWYLLAMNEGHGFAKRENFEFEQEVRAMFLLKYLSHAHGE